MAARIWNANLKTKLISLSVLSVTAVLVVVGVVQYRGQSSRLHDALATSLDATAARLSANLAGPLWDLSKDQGQAVLQPELSLRDIEAILVKGTDGSLFAAVARQGDQAVPVSAAEALPAAALAKAFDVLREGKAIGTVEIRYSEEGLHVRLREQLLLTLAQIVAVDACLVGVLLALFSAFVLRPVRLLVQEATWVREEVALGRLRARGDGAKVIPEFRPIIEGMNATLEAVTGPLAVAARCVEQISQGEIPEQIQDPYAGDFARIKDNLNTCIAAVNLLVRDANHLADAAVSGQLSTRADASRHQGDFRRIVEGVNKTLDATTAPIAEAAQVLDRLAQRDLTARVGGAYRGDHAKIKEAVNATGAELHAALAQVARAVGQVSSAAGQIAASSQAVAAGASEQASSLEETGASLESISSMTRRAADNAQQANALAQQGKGAAAQGSAAMAQMGEAMAKIKASAHGTSQIIKDINEIAFQTNLLALNAAVEAARAGEAGRGFAVVAEEVRSLALRSKEAANKTEALISDSVRQAGEGELTAKRVAAQLNEIATSVTQVSEIVAEITASSKEQATGLDQVNHAMKQVGQVTQQNAASSEESSSSAAELSSEAERLAAMIGTFRIDGADADPAQAGGAAARAQPAGRRVGARPPRLQLTAGPRDHDAAG